MSEHKYGLALGNLRKDNPDFQKAARKSASAKPVNLEKRRLDFEQENMMLQALIGKIQVLSAKLAEAASDERGALEQEIAKYYNIASLKGMAGLYQGFALLADMLSFRDVKRDDDGNPVLDAEGQKTFVRIPVLFDEAAYLEELLISQHKTQRLLYKMALKSGAVFDKQAGIDPDLPEEVHVASVEDAIAGVPEAEIAAAQQTPTEEQVEKFVKGEREK